MSFEDEIARMHAVIGERLGVAAVFQPIIGSAQSDVRVELDRPDALAQFGEAKAKAPDWTLRVAVAALAQAPVKNDRFVLTVMGRQRVLRVASVRPKEDVDGALHVLDVVEANS